MFASQKASICDKTDITLTSVWGDGVHIPSDFLWAGAAVTGNYSMKGHFTPWTMLSDHRRWPFFHGATYGPTSMFWLYDSTSMVQFAKTQFSKFLTSTTTSWATYCGALWRNLCSQHTHPQRFNHLCFPYTQNPYWVLLVLERLDRNIWL